MDPFATLKNWGFVRAVKGELLINTCIMNILNISWHAFNEKYLMAFWWRTSGEIFWKSELLSFHVGLPNNYMFEFSSSCRTESINCNLSWVFLALSPFVKTRFCFLASVTRVLQSHDTEASCEWCLICNITILGVQSAMMSLHNIHNHEHLTWKSK